MVKKYFLVMLTMLLTVVSSAQSFEGKDFWVGYMPNSDNVGLTNRLHFISRVATTVLVEIPLTGYSATVVVPAKTMISHNLPGAALTTASEVISKKGVHVTCPDDITVYTGSYKDYTSDAAIAIPTPQLGTDLDIVTYGFTEIGVSQFIIVGTENNTTIKIVYHGWTDKGKKTGNTDNITLNKGETYLVQSYGPTPIPTPTDLTYKDLSGTKVTVTNNKKIAVFSGNECVYAGGCPFCDAMYEQMRPSSTWGTTHYLVNTIKGSTTADIMRVYALQNGTTYTINGAPQLGLAAGAWRDHDVAVGTVVVSNNPVHVSQYLRGSSCSAPPLEIDPLMLDVLPAQQYASDYLFGTSDYARYSKHYATVVVETAQTGTLQLDGIPVGVAFTPIVGTTYSTGYITLARGRTYNLVSTNGSRFGLFIYGYGQEESYGYTAGGNLFKLDGCPLAKFTADSVCDGKAITFTNQSLDPSYTIVAQNWDFGGFGSSTALNPTFVFPAPGSYSVKLKVTNNGPTACADSVTRTIIVHPNPTAFAGPDVSVCFGDSAQLGATPAVTGGTTPFSYAWSPASGVGGSTLPRPKAKPAVATEYELTVTDKYKCTGKDKVKVSLQQPDSVFISADGTICKGDSYDLKIRIATVSTDPFNVQITDGTTVTTLTNITNGYTHTVSPQITSTYSIVSFTQPSNPLACLYMDLQTVKVTVRDIPTATFVGNAVSICEGSSYTMTVNLTGTGNKNLSYTDGVGVQTLANLSGATKTITVTPSSTTTYTLTNIEYGTTPACKFNPNKSFTVTVNKKRNPGLGSTIDLCNTGTPVNLFNLLSNSPENTGTWADLNSSGATILGAINTVVDPTFINAGTYTYTYKLLGNAPCVDSTSTVIIKVKDSPILSNIKTTCAADNKTFTVTGTVTKGNPLFYQTESGNSIVNQSGNYVFTSAPFPSKSNYAINIWDDFKCDSANANGYLNCGCLTKAGSMNQTAIEICKTGVALAVHNADHVLLPARMDTLLFYLHEGSGTQIVNLKAINSIPSFTYLPGMVYGQTYYISAVAGTWNGTQINFADPDSCVSVAQGTPVRFFDLPTGYIAGSSDICLNTNLNVLSNLTGSAPFSIDLYAKDTTITYANINPQDTIFVANLMQSDTIKLMSISDKYCVNGSPSSLFLFQTHDTPIMVGPSSAINCNPTADFYTWTFSISNGDPSSYTITPSGLGSLVGNTFTSNPIATGSGINVTIGDAFGCGTDIQTITNNCPCLTIAGAMLPATVDVCKYNVANLLPAVGTVLDPNDIQYYIITTSITSPIDSLIDVNTAPTFGFDSMTMVLEKTYYVMSIAGTQSGVSGAIDYTDRCLSIGAATPVVFHAPPVVTGYTASPAIICTGGSANLLIQITGNSPYSFYSSQNGVAIPMQVINTPSTNKPLTPLVNTVLKVDSVVDKYGCVSVGLLQTKIDLNPAPTFSVTGSTTVCEGSSANITVSILSGIPPFSFTITDGGALSNSYTNYASSTAIEQVNSLTPGTHQYYLTSFKDSICPAATLAPIATVTVNANPTGYFLSAPPAICDKDPLVINFNSPSGSQFSISGTGNSAPFSVPVISNGMPVVGLNYVIGNNTYAITNITDLTTGCSSVMGTTINVLVRTLPSASVCCGTNICLNDTGSVQLTTVGSGPFNVSFAGVPGAISIGSAGVSPISFVPPGVVGSYNYTLSGITDVFNCSSTLTALNGIAKISVFEKPLVDFSIDNPESCSPLAYLIQSNTTSSLPFELTWQVDNAAPIASLRDIQGTITASGIHNVNLHAINTAGCQSNITKQLLVHPNPVAAFSFSETRPTILDSRVYFINTSIADVGSTYTWNINPLDTVFSGYSPAFVFPDDDAGLYDVQLHVATPFGCVDSTSRALKVQGQSAFYIPNTFTPNGDGVNDMFFPVVFGVELDDVKYEFDIFDRWGHNLFHGSNLKEGWDGTYKGNKVMSGVYECRVSVKGKYSIERNEIITAVRLLR